MAEVNPTDSDEQWACSQCTFLNCSMFLACEVCLAEKVTSKSPAAKRLIDQVYPPTLPAPKNTTGHIVSRHLKPESVTMDQDPQFNKDQNKLF